MPLGIPQWIWWGGVGLFAGLIAVNIIPWLVAPIGGLKWKQRIGSWYTSMACRAGKRVTIIERKTGGLDLRPTRPDGETPAEGVKLDGDQNHVRNDLGCIGWLHNRQFGFSLEKPNLYVDALWAETGEKMYRARSEDTIRTDVEVATDGGTEVVQAFSDRLALDEDPVLVRLRDTRRAVAGSGEAFDGQRGYEIGKKSQEKYWERLQAKEVVMLAILYAVGAAGVWFAANYGTAVSDGGATTVMPGMMQVAGVLL